MSLRRLLPALALAVLLGGCQPLPTRPIAAAPIEAPAATEPGPLGADDRLNAVAWMQASIEYRLLAGQTWRSALLPLDRAIKTPAWDALPKEDRATLPAGLPLAVIVDIDDTVLDVTGGDVIDLERGQPFDHARWNAWAAKASAPAIPGALEFARAAAARGVTLYYVTNRVPELAAATLANLRSLGFPVKDDTQLLTRGMHFDGCEEPGDSKACRRREVGKTHRVLLLFGDSLGDFVAPAANTTEGREQAVRPYLGWVGERWFALPNPVYGSWLRSLEGEAGDASQEAKRQRVRASLHD